MCARRANRQQRNARRSASRPAERAAERAVATARRSKPHVIPEGTRSPNRQRFEGPVEEGGNGERECRCAEGMWLGMSACPRRTTRRCTMSFSTINRTHAKRRHTHKCFSEQTCLHRYNAARESSNHMRYKVCKGEGACGGRCRASSPSVHLKERASEWRNR